MEMDNDNPATGAVTIAAGASLQLGNGGTTGSIASTSIVDNGTLSFNRTDTALDLATTISGSGGVKQIGSGTTTLSGNNTFGGTVDGTILMDPYPVAQLLAYTGPQQLPEISFPIDATNAVDFILRDQYLQLGHDARVDLLSGLAKQTLDSLLAGAMPSPIQAAKDLGPFVREHRLMMWTDNPQEQELFDVTGLSGRFPPTVDGADFGITFNNAGPNKMEAYLTHSVTTSERVDSTFGPLLDITLTLENTAPTSGLPDYVAANTSGYPPATDYLYLSVYGPGTAIDTRRDGNGLGSELSQELGLGVTSAFIDLAAGQRTVLTFTFQTPGETPPNGWRVFVAPSAQRR